MVPPKATHKGYFWKKKIQSVIKLGMQNDSADYNKYTQTFCITTQL